MKHFFSLLIAAMLGQSAAFSQSNPLFKYLPDDITMVMSIDAKSLGSKIPAETFRQSFFYREMMKDPNMPLAAFLSEPEKLGIDLSGGIVLAIKEESIEGMERTQPGFYLFIKLRDAEVFTANMKKIAGDEGKIAMYGTDRILLSEASMTAAWNNDVFIVSNGYANKMRQSFLNDFSYSDTVPPDPAKIERAKRELMKGQREMCFELLTPKSQNTISSNTYFIEAMNTPADIRLWSSGSGNPITKKMLPFAGIMEKLGSISGKNKTALINFENGKIVMRSRNFLGEVTADIYKKYHPTPQNMDLVKRLPAGTLMGLATVSFNQEMANELIQKNGLMGILDSVKKEIPFDLSLLPGVFKSNMMIAVVKTDITATTDTLTSQKGGMQLVIALPIADKVKFENLKAAIPALLDSVKGIKEKLFEKSPLFAKHTDDMLVITMSPQTADEFLQNKGTGEVPAWLQEYSKHPMVVTIGLKEIMSGILGNNRPEDNRQGMIATVMSKFDKILVYGGGYENESINSTMEFRFSDPNENSLKQMFDMVTSIAESEEARRAERENEMVMDTAIMAPADTVAIMDTVSIASVRPAVPTFKDPELQEFAKEYDEFISEYIAYVKIGKTDSAKLAVMAKISEEWPDKFERLNKKITNDPDEMKKFSEWLVAASQHLGAVIRR